jgi:cellulose synthase/poly-beta-1,6-N-acetylglucosamine synthase-like glycosyltransferase
MLRGPYIPASSTLIRRSALRDVGDFDESLFVEDYGLWLRLARDHRIVAVPDVVAEKRLHGANASLVQQRRIFRDMLDLIVREKRHVRADPVATAERVSSRNRWYYGVVVHGTTADLLRVLIRHPVAGPLDLLEARRALADKV